MPQQLIERLATAQQEYSTAADSEALLAASIELSDATTQLVELVRAGQFVLLLGEDWQAALTELVQLRMHAQALQNTDVLRKMLVSMAQAVQPILATMNGVVEKLDSPIVAGAQPPLTVQDPEPPEPFRTRVLREPRGAWWGVVENKKPNIAGQYVAMRYTGEAESAANIGRLLGVDIERNSVDGELTILLGEAPTGGRYYRTTDAGSWIVVPIEFDPSQSHASSKVTTYQKTGAFKDDWQLVHQHQ